MRRSDGLDTGMSVQVLDGAGDGGVLVAFGGAGVAFSCWCSILQPASNTRLKRITGRGPRERRSHSRGRGGNIGLGGEITAARWGVKEKGLPEGAIGGRMAWIAGGRATAARRLP